MAQQVVDECSIASDGEEGEEGEETMNETNDDMSPSR